MKEEIKDKSSFEQLYEIAPLAMQNSLETIPEKVLEMTDKELSKKFRLDDMVILRRVRLSLWNEADRVINSGSVLKMRLASVYEGLCDRKYFQKKIMGNSFALAFISRRPNNYNVLMTEILEYGLNLNREILDMDHVDEEGRINTKLLDIKMKIIENTHNRLKGTPVSRQQIVQTNYNKGGSGDLDYSNATTKELQEEIKKLKGGDS